MQSFENTDQTAIIIGNGLNSLAILEALQVCGWNGKTVFIKLPDEKPAFDQLVKGVETWCLPLRHPSDLLVWLAERHNGERRRFLFLTDERFHQALLNETRGGALRNTVFYLGSQKANDVILDRYRFYEYLKQERLCNVPKTLEGGENPWNVFRDRFLFRFKHSWQGLRRLDRVQFIENRTQWNRLVQHYKSLGLSDKDWCYQELLSTNPKDNISICGWHEHREPIYCVTRAVLRHPPLRGTALVCERLDGYDHLKSQASDILSSLDYHGPFELEYVRDPNSGKFKVIELNPRFWLQHSLMQQATGYRLMRKYLGMIDVGSAPSEKRFWVSTAHAMVRLFLGDVRVAGYLLSKKTVRAPSFCMATRFILNDLAARLKRCVSLAIV